MTSAGGCLAQKVFDVPERHERVDVVAESISVLCKCPESFEEVFCPLPPYGDTLLEMAASFCARWDRKRHAACGTDLLELFLQAGAPAHSLTHSPLPSAGTCQSGDLAEMLLTLLPEGADGALATDYRVVTAMETACHIRVSDFLIKVSPLDERMMAVLPLSWPGESLLEAVDFLNDPRNVVGEDIWLGDTWEKLVQLSHRSDLFSLVELALLCGASSSTSGPVQLACDVPMLELLLCSGSNPNVMGVPGFRNTVLLAGPSPASTLELLLLCGCEQRGDDLDFRVDTGDCGDLICLLLPSASPDVLSRITDSAVVENKPDALSLLLCAAQFPFTALPTITLGADTATARFWLSCGLVCRVFDFHSWLPNRTHSVWSSDCPVTDTETHLFTPLRPCKNSGGVPFASS